jgi:hypothetical protein
MIKEIQFPRIIDIIAYIKEIIETDPAAALGSNSKKVVMKYGLFFAQAL